MFKQSTVEHQHIHKSLSCLNKGGEGGAAEMPRALVYMTLGEGSGEKYD